MEYVLGSSDHELARLRLQHDVWRAVTGDFHARVALPAGARCLDVGCGPGFTTEDLSRLAGPDGEVTALDESARWIEVVRERAREEGWTNVRAVQGRVEEVELAEGAYDLVHARWVLSFVPDPAAAVARLARLLRPNGALLVIDYNHEGVSLFPRSRGFEAVIRSTRALYASNGGDTFLMGRALELFRAAGLRADFVEPRVLCGPPGSPVFRWADAFFPFHTEGMVRAGLLAEEERRVFLDEWAERAADPTTLFFSPIVVGAAGRRASAS